MFSTISMFPQVMHMWNRIEVVQSWYRRMGYKLKYVPITITRRLHALASARLSSSTHPCTALQPAPAAPRQAQQLWALGCSLQSQHRHSRAQHAGGRGCAAQNNTRRDFRWWPSSPSRYRLIKTFLANRLVTLLCSPDSMHCQGLKHISRSWSIKCDFWSFQHTRTRANVTC